MDCDSKIAELVEEALNSDRSPEEVCQACPERVPEVRARWERCRAMDRDLDQLFPPFEAAEIKRAASSSPFPAIPNYEVLDIVGQGGVGIIFRVRHVGLDRVVALKMLLSGPYASPHELARFTREAQAVASLQHPNIVQIYDVGDVEGLAYFTMEFVAGGNLAQRQAGVPQSARQSTDVIETIARAIHVAHLAGIVHRDLKPGNILLMPDGTPKVSDFGLAHRFEIDVNLTTGGARVGTPSYMAPEQVAGRPGAVGPAADVYGLGATLYELLTGRPPFRAETLAETQRQLLEQEPAAPSALNAKVPRDLETICLKCLQKDPARRYGSAMELAEDLARFREGLPIRARRTTAAARALRWCRRKPAAAALLGTLVLLAGSAISGGWWLSVQRAEHREETARLEGRRAAGLEVLLQRANEAIRQNRWREAQAVLDGAPSLLGMGQSSVLVDRVRVARADADMVVALEDIRLRLFEGQRDGETGPPRGDLLYADAFENYGVTCADAPQAAARIRASAVRETLIAYMHEWLFRRAREEDRPPIRAVLDRADDDAWRKSARAAIGGTDMHVLSQVLDASAAPDQPPVVLYAVSTGLDGSPVANEARNLLREAQRRHPDDFWLNFQLGYYLQQDHPQEAVGSLRAAVALRPNCDQAYTILGRALRNSGDDDDAIAAFRRAIELNSNRFGARDLARVLTAKGKLEEARALWEKIVAREPVNYDAWYGYAQLCAYLGETEAYERGRVALLNQFENADDATVAERTGLACLLMPASSSEQGRAAALIERALANGPEDVTPGNVYLQFAHGLAEFRQRRYASAIALLQKSVVKLPNRPGPRLVLAMAQFQAGSPADARQTLAAAVRAYDWNEAEADHPTAWVSHVLRREAEAMVLPKLKEFLASQYQPTDNAERLALLGVCQARGMTVAAARLCADAFAAEPGLADELSVDCMYRAAGEGEPLNRSEALGTECRYVAARAAALAGCGTGVGAAALDPTARAKLRNQARDWLHADLLAWAKTLDNGAESSRDLVSKMLTRWQTCPELAGVREPDALDKLPAAEREAWLALWADVEVALKRATQSGKAGVGPAAAQAALRASLREKSQLENARITWNLALSLNPVEHDTWYGYAELCAFLDEPDEYRAARRKLLTRFGTSADPFIAERVSRACLLEPSSGDELRQVTSLADRAVVEHSYDRWAAPYFQFVQGFSQYRQGQFEKSIATLQGDAAKVLGPAPGMIRAMALKAAGRDEEARLAFAGALKKFDWDAERVTTRDGWMFHVLRRQAELALGIQ